MADYADLLAAEHAKKTDKTPVSPAKSTPQKNEKPETAKTSQLAALRHDVMTSPRHEVDYGVTTRSVKNRTLSRQSNEISWLKSKAFAYRGGISRSNPAPTPPPRAARTSPTC